jgi:hypothetical protein
MTGPVIENQVGWETPEGSLVCMRHEPAGDPLTGEDVRAGEPCVRCGAPLWGELG